MHKIIKNKQAVSNQLVALSSIAIFIIVVLAGVANIIDRSEDNKPEIDRVLMDKNAERIMGFLTDYGSTPEGSHNWEDVVETIKPTTIGLRMDPDDIPEAISTALPVDPGEDPNNNPPELEYYFPSQDQTNVSCDINLTWGNNNLDGDDVTYAVYLDDDYPPTNSEPYIFADEENSGNLKYDPPQDLESDWDYWWQINASDGVNDWVVGQPGEQNDIYHFKTGDGNKPNHRPAITNLDVCWGDDSTFGETAVGDGDGDGDGDDALQDGGDDSAITVLRNINTCFTATAEDEDEGDPLHIKFFFSESPIDEGDHHGPSEDGEEDSGHGINWIPTDWIPPISSDDDPMQVETPGGGGRSPFTAYTYHKFTSTGLYGVNATAFDEVLYSINNPYITVDVINKAPHLVAYGDNVVDDWVGSGQEFWVMISFGDLNEDDVSYRIDWDNSGYCYPSPCHDYEDWDPEEDDVQQWSDYQPYNYVYFVNHTYYNPNPYMDTTKTITFEAKDGYPDGLSDPLTVQITVKGNQLPPNPNIFLGGQLPCCFPAGTMISMADGSLKPIEKVMIGDSVVSYDLDEQKNVICEIVNKVSPVKQGVYNINNGLIRPTDDHPLYVQKSDGRKGWAAAEPVRSEDAYDLDVMKLEVGDKLLTSDGEWVTIDSVDYEPGTILTYTLDVEDENTFYANDLVVHNMAIECPLSFLQLCCLPEGTMVTMADDTSKPIEQLKIGDQVMSYDFEKQEPTSCEILKIVNPVREGVYNINNGLIRPTDDHPLYVQKSDGRKGWAAINPSKSHFGYDISLTKLEVGDKLLTSDGGWVTIYSIEFEPGDIKTYNLNIKDIDNFFANGLLVHNGDSQTGGGAMSICETFSASLMCCFPGETQVTMADGSYKNIENVKRGDLVLSYDIDNKNIVADRVKSISMPVRKGVYNINNGLLRPTNDHPLYVIKSDGRKGWAAVDPLASMKAYRTLGNIMPVEIGDTLFTMQGLINVESIEFEPGLIITYTLSLDSHHQFFANDVLVSNINQAGQGMFGEIGGGDGPDDCSITPNCFLKGSKVAMADGSLKNIEDIVVGDMVKTYDTENEIFTVDEIVEIMHDKPEMMLDYYLIINENIRVTPEHPLYINNQWVLANDLKIGSVLTSGDQVFSIEKVYERVPTFNLETKTYHNYLIVYGEQGQYLIAHNSYAVGGNEEQDNNPTNTNSESSLVVNLKKAYALNEITYEKAKELFQLESHEEFIIELSSQDGTEIYLSYPLEENRSRSPENSEYVAISTASVIVCDPTPRQLPNDQEYFFWEEATLTVKLY